MADGQPAPGYPSARYQAQFFRSERKSPRWRWRVVDLTDVDPADDRPRAVVSSAAGWTDREDATANLEEAALALETAVLLPLRRGAAEHLPRRGLWRRLLAWIGR